MNYRELAQLLGAQGRYGDTELVHVTPREKKLLRRSGGSGTTNPITGLDEYFEVDPTPAAGNNLGVDTAQEVGAGQYATDVGTAAPAGTFGSEFDVGTSMLPDIGPDVEVGTLPATPAISDGLGLGGFGSALMANYGRIGPSLSRDGAIAIPGLALQAMVPGAGLMRGGIALATTIAEALGYPVTHGEGYPENPGVGEVERPIDALVQQMDAATAPAATSGGMQIPSATAPNYSGLEPYMRDYLRRQGIFV